jgi:hypothetical protein
MPADWVATGTSSIAALAAAWIGARAGVRREWRLRKREGLAEAAGEVAEALRAVREVVRRSEYDQANPNDVHGALTAFQAAWDKHEHRFPKRWPQLQREINFAVGTHFGPVGWSNRFLDQADAPFLPRDALWGENAEGYLDHVIRHTARWGDEPGRRQPAPLRFDPWLAERQRRFDEGPREPLIWKLLITALGGRRRNAGPT